MVSATPNSITVGWVPPKYENGKGVVERAHAWRSITPSGNLFWVGGDSVFARARMCVQQGQVGDLAVGLALAVAGIVSISR